jgi:hypothetical protein
MAKMNWEKISKQNRESKQPILNFDKKTKKSKLAKLWQKAIHNETKFLSGKYWNQDVAGIVKTNPNYCIWVLENEPTSVVAKQIIRHFNR